MTKSVWYRFWYYGAYIDVVADSANEAKQKIGTLATIKQGDAFVMVPVIGEPTRYEE